MTRSSYDVSPPLPSDRVNVSVTSAVPIDMSPDGSWSPARRRFPRAYQRGHDRPRLRGVPFLLREDDSLTQLEASCAHPYRMVSMSHAELTEKVAPCGELGAYLIKQTLEVAATDPGPLDYRKLGDSPAIGLILNPLGAIISERPAQRFTPAGTYEPGAGHPIRVIEQVDTRYLMEDMFAKLRQFGRS